MANPDLMRLMAWSAPEQKVQGPSERVAALEEKGRALTEAQKAGRVGTAFAPGFLVIAVMSLATAWSRRGRSGRLSTPRPPSAKPSFGGASTRRVAPPPAP